jgi:hypothetical protein
MAANYGAYKKISSNMIPDGAVNGNMLQQGVGNKYCSFTVHSDRGMKCQECTAAGGCCCMACGRCCEWTVPNYVTSVQFEIWSGGGSGAGMNCSNCCSYSVGGAGGSYATKTICTRPGCKYTICAGGVWRCCRSHTCSGGMGCASYVTGHNLDNFCVVGGCGGLVCHGDDNGYAFMQTCANCNICGIYGADFGATGSTGYKLAHSGCKCQGSDYHSAGAAPFIAKHHSHYVTEFWCSCSCYVNWPSGGGLSGASTYCGDAAKCCAAGMFGGSGLVKITFA